MRSRTEQRAGISPDRHRDGKAGQPSHRFLSHFLLPDSAGLSGPERAQRGSGVARPSGRPDVRLHLGQTGLHLGQDGVLHLGAVR